MRDDSTDDSPVDRSPDPEPSKPASTTQEWDIVYEDLSEIETGDVIAVKASADFGDSILAGTITWRSNEHPHEEAQKCLEEAEEMGGRPDHWRVPVLSIDANVWWVISENEVDNRSEYLQNRPPMQPHLGEPPQAPPDCAISYRTDGRLDLTIPCPISNGHRVKWYSPDPCGRVVEILHGGIVEPKNLLPDRIDPIE